jgi:hypothetical protein
MTYEANKAIAREFFAAVNNHRGPAKVSVMPFLRYSLGKRGARRATLSNPPLHCKGARSLI